MNVASYIKETKAEMKHVSWPTRRQVVVYTGIVIAVSLMTALLLGLFDFIFSRSLGALIISSPAPQMRTDTDTGRGFGDSAGSQDSEVFPQSSVPATSQEGAPLDFSPKAAP